MRDEAWFKPRFDKDYLRSIAKHGDPGFTKGRKYQMKDFCHHAGTTYIYLINDHGEEIAMDSRSLEEVG